MTGWNEHGHARPTGLSLDRYLGRGHLQDAEDCGYRPDAVLAELDIDPERGEPWTQFSAGRIVLRDGTILERGGTLGAVWAITQLPAHEGKCPICYPARWDGPIPETALRPDACPARGNHERITWTFDLIRTIEAKDPSLDRMAYVEKVMERIEQLRAVP